MRPPDAVHLLAEGGEIRYAYYLCSRAKKAAEQCCEVGRVPAGDVERAVYEQIGRILNNKDFVDTLSKTGELPKEDIRLAVENTEAFFESLFPIERKRLVRLLVERIDLGPDSLDIELKTAGCERLVEAMMHHD